MTKSLAALTYSAMHELEGMITIQLFAEVKCPFLDIFIAADS